MAGAQCHSGECCNSQCRFKDSLSVCRPSAGQCDIEDYCTGLLSDCPTDAYIQDSTTCNNNQSYCFSGQCKTYNIQCQRHFRTSEPQHKSPFQPISLCSTEQIRGTMLASGTTQLALTLETAALTEHRFFHVNLSKYIKKGIQEFLMFIFYSEISCVGSCTVKLVEDIRIWSPLCLC